MASGSFFHDEFKDEATARQRLHRRYKCLPFEIRVPWIPSISFHFPKASVVIGLNSLVHWMAEGLMRIGCIADPITIAVDREDGTGEIVEGNGMLMGGSEQPASDAE